MPSNTINQYIRIFIFRTFIIDQLILYIARQVHKKTLQLMSSHVPGPYIDDAINEAVYQSGVSHIAGGAALEDHMRSIGQASKREPSDIDVFITKLTHIEEMLSVVYGILAGLEKAGYRIMPGAYMFRAPIIVVVVTHSTKAPRNLQFIASSHSTIENVIASFDISVCQVYMRKECTVSGSIAFVPQMRDNVRQDVANGVAYVYQPRSSCSAQHCGE